MFYCIVFILFFKQKTAYDVRISDWSSDVCSSDLGYNVSVVVAGATCLGIAAGLVGSFTFLRRRALVADALSHATLPGIALAFLLGVAFGLEQRSLALLLAGAAATGAS